MSGTWMRIGVSSWWRLRTASARVSRQPRKRGEDTNTETGPGGTLSMCRDIGTLETCRHLARFVPGSASMNEQPTGNLGVAHSLARVTLTPISLGISFAFLLRGDRPILVDTGRPKDFVRLQKALASHGVA